MLSHLKDAELAPTVIEEKKRGLSRNKNAGHGYELNVRDIFRNLGYLNVTTSRAESRNRDNQQIDLINEDEHINGRLPYNVQCKATSQIVNYHEIFNDTEKMVKVKKGPLKGTKVAKVIKGMPIIKGVINVVFHKYTRLVIRESILKNGTVRMEEIFEPVDYYAIIRKQDFIMIMAERLELEQLKEENKRLLDMLNKGPNGSTY